jgi:hypothetical protein
MTDQVAMWLCLNCGTEVTMWADNWARQIESRYPGSMRAMTTILDRLTTQAAISLTLSQEIADLRAEFGDVKTYDGRGSETDI